MTTKFGAYIKPATDIQQTVLLRSSIEGSGTGDARRPGTASLAVPAILLVLALLLPYLNKAYTIDDPLFLLSACQILKNPLQPMSFPVCWNFDTCVKFAANLGPLGSQPLMGYLMVPVVLAGGAEWIPHAIQILLVCIAVLAMIRLALRLGCDRVQAAMAGLMLIAIPPCLSMASTAMPDTLAAALGLTGFERLLAWKDDRRWRDAAVAALTLGFAPLARPHLALLLPLGTLWLFDEFRPRIALQQLRRQAYLWTPVVIAVCILIVVHQLTRDRNPALEVHDVMIQWAGVPKNLYAYFLYLSFPIPFAAVWLAIRGRKAPVLLVLPVILALADHFIMHPSSNLVQIWPRTAALCGLTALVHMIYHYVRAGDRLGLLLGLWMLIPLPVSMYIHLPIKYMLIVLPAIVLILIRSLSTLPRPRALSVYGALVLACGAYSCVLLRADADFAEGGRRAVAELIAPHVAAGEKVWYGGEWGFYWYAQEAGARISKPGEPGPNPGDLLAVALLEGGDRTLTRFPSRELIDSRHYDSPHGRTMGYGGGLYSNNWGHALWVWNPKAANDYELWRIH